MHDVANGATYVHQVDGRELAYKLRRRTPAERARLAAICAAGGGIALHKPTTGQLATLFRVSVPSLVKARNGVRPKETLAEHFSRCSPDEWRDAARTIGVDRVWDVMIAPLVAAAEEAAP